ncbi:MAG: thioredoxin domain-containing protein [Candidatus Sulfotelmatobacter sp.]
MLVSRIVLSLGLATALAFAAMGRCAAQTDGDDSVVANVGGVTITMSDLEQEESAKLLAARYQYYQVETKALNDLIDKKLLERKAAAEHLTVAELLDREVASKVKDPAEDQMKVYYEGIETDQPFEAVREKILEKIRQLRSDRAKTAYLQTLRTESTVYVVLAPPSASLEAANPQMTQGPKNAQVTLVEFADYECPYCQKVAPDVKKLAADFGNKVSFAFKDFPLPMHSRAEKAAEAARCASKQNKFWEFHDELFHSKELDVDQLKAQARALKLDAEQFDKCLDSGEEAAEVDRDRKEGNRLGINGTPSFFINGHFMSGALDYATLRQAIEQQLTLLPQTVASAGK